MPPIHDDPVRAYRHGHAPRPGETAFQVVVAQTDLLIVAKRTLPREIGDFVSQLRAGLSTSLLLNPDFQHSFTPVPADAAAPAIAKEMAEAAARFGVGPMAAVAGAFAQAVADRFVGESPEILVENGGDVYLHGSRERIVALEAQREDIDKAIAELKVGCERLEQHLAKTRPDLLPQAEDYHQMLGQRLGDLEHADAK